MRNKCVWSTSSFLHPKFRNYQPEIQRVVFASVLLPKDWLGAALPREVVRRLPTAFLRPQCFNIKNNSSNHSEKSLNLYTVTWVQDSPLVKELLYTRSRLGCLQSPLLFTIHTNMSRLSGLLSELDAVDKLAEGLVKKMATNISDWTSSKMSEGICYNPGGDWIWQSSFHFDGLVLIKFLALNKRYTKAKNALSSYHSNIMDHPMSAERPKYVLKAGEEGSECTDEPGKSFTICTRK